MGREEVKCEGTWEEAFSGLVKGDVYEGMISCVTPEVGELKHTINFIPAGTDEYFEKCDEFKALRNVLEVSEDFEQRAKAQARLEYLEYWFDENEWR